MTTIQKKVITVFRDYPELLEQSADHSLCAQREHLHKKFLLFMEKIDFQVDYNNKNYNELLDMFQILHLFDIELVVKMAIQFNLWGETISKIGTHKHETYLRKTEKLDIFGCFAMTEIGHGSNIMKLETTATYNHDNREFTIHTPFHSSHKYWIGQASMFAHYAIVFAQLIMDKDSKGVHPFIVPLRSLDNKVYDTITIQDCGIKSGLNGIDNGAIICNQVVIPYDNLLDRYAHIDSDGIYHTVTGRLSKMLNELTKNRLGMGLGTNIVSRYALAQTLDYTKKRRQFGNNFQEHSILQYTTTQHRLLPLLAKTYMNMIFNNYAKQCLDNPNHVHFNSIISKTNGSWNALRTLQQCRECCGGHGYHYHSYFGKLYRNLDIYTTFEGDNTVLLQQLVQSLLKEYQKKTTPLRAISYVMLKKCKTLQYFIPNIIANVDYNLDIHSFKRYIQYRIDYKLVSLLLYFNKKKNEEMDSFDMWNSKLTQINELAKLITFNNTLDIALHSLHSDNRPLIEIYILQHIKENGLFYVVDNSISISLINNLDKSLEKNYKIIINNLDKYLQLLEVPNIDDIMPNHLHTIKSCL